MHTKKRTCSRRIDKPELTISGQLLEETKKLGGLGKVGCALGKTYAQQQKRINIRFTQLS